MEEPEKIIDFIKKYFSNIKKKRLAGKKILVTAGPTIEPIDPVRYITNHSTGKMGYAIAEELAGRGMEVILISGPVSLQARNPNITVIPVTTADEMYRMSVKHFPSCRAAVMCAAVADYKPVQASVTKIKRKEGNVSIALQPNKDIAAELGKMKKRNQVLVGFALETNDGIRNATGKLKKKNLDFIVLNSLADKQACFGYDTNKITILHRGNKRKDFELKSKAEVAEDIVNEVKAICY